MATGSSITLRRQTTWSRHPKRGGLTLTPMENTTMTMEYTTTMIMMCLVGFMG